MKNTKAFTLIELLVVVLIIGILASVALPQYQKAVEKSRATQGLTVLKSLAQAAKAHYMASGSYATRFDELDVEMPWTGTTKGYTGVESTDTRSSDDWSLQIYTAHNQNSLFMYRIRGPYQGIMFEYRLYTADAEYKSYEDKLICWEQLQGSNLLFTKSAGSYCQKIVQGTPKDSFAYGRSYTLPF
ncbi:type IV pilin protein [Candidatus Avelusimicrobium luingense]|uniref:type IV pilin protein n=1 Tax=Candidatus Avelusimicrobium luingense TaxID=3416211 RepID=UPI003D0C2A4D